MQTAPMIGREIEKRQGLLTTLQEQIGEREQQGNRLTYQARYSTFGPEYDKVLVQVNDILAERDALRERARIITRELRDLHAALNRQHRDAEIRRALGNKTLPSFEVPVDDLQLVEQEYARRLKTFVSAFREAALQAEALLVAVEALTPQRQAEVLAPPAALRVLVPDSTFRGWLREAIATGLVE